MFLHPVPKASNRSLEQGINIELCVKLGNNASDACAVLFEACGGETVMKSSVLSGINDPRKLACRNHK
jgi:hypothetical protein